MCTASAVRGQGKIMEREIICPSGLSGKIRPLKVSDQKLSVDPHLLKSGRLLSEWCRRCWLETTNPGPYTFDKEIDWSNLIQGDVFWTFLQIRMLTYGNVYEFVEPCTHCNKAIKWSFDLSTLSLKMLPEQSRFSFTANLPLETQLEDGRKVQFRLLLGKDDAKIQQLQDSRKLPRRYAATAQRLVSVENVPNDYWALVNFVEELDDGEAQLLEEKMELADCGVDTDIDVLCMNCGMDQVVVLPFQVGLFRRPPTNPSKKPTSNG